MARGQRSERNPNRKVDVMSHMSRIKDTILGGSYNTDLDDPNTPEYTGQEARLSDLAPRNIMDNLSAPKKGKK